jgi:hypothetical protein
MRKEKEEEEEALGFVGGWGRVGYIYIYAGLVRVKGKGQG